MLSSFHNREHSGTMGAGLSAAPESVTLESTFADLRSAENFLAVVAARYVSNHHDMHTLRGFPISTQDHNSSRALRYEEASVKRWWAQWQCRHFPLRPEWLQLWYSPSCRQRGASILSCSRPVHSASSFPWRGCESLFQCRRRSVGPTTNSYFWCQRLYYCLDVLLCTRPRGY